MPVGLAMPGALALRFHRGIKYRVSVIDLGQTNVWSVLASKETRHPVLQHEIEGDQSVVSPTSISEIFDYIAWNKVTGSVEWDVRMIVFVVWAACATSAGTGGLPAVNFGWFGLDRANWFHKQDYVRLMDIALGKRLSCMVVRLVMSGGGSLGVSDLVKADNVAFRTWLTQVSLHPAVLLHGLATQLPSKLPPSMLAEFLKAGTRGLQSPLTLFKTTKSRTKRVVDATVAALERWPAQQKRAKLFECITSSGARHHRNPIVQSILDNGQQLATDGYLDIRDAKRQRVPTTELFAANADSVLMLESAKDMVLCSAAVRVLLHLKTPNTFVVCVPHWPTRIGMSTDYRKQPHSQRLLSPHMLPLVKTRERKSDGSKRTVSIQNGHDITWEALDILFDAGFTNVVVYGWPVEPSSVMAILMSGQVCPNAVKIESDLLSDWQRHAADPQVTTEMSNIAARMTNEIMRTGWLDLPSSAGLKCLRARATALVDATQ